MWARAAPEPASAAMWTPLIRRNLLYARWSAYAGMDVGPCQKQQWYSTDSTTTCVRYEGHDYMS